MKTITVKGMGKVSVKPDLIVISMNLETKDKDYEQTMNLASEKINMLSKALQNVSFKKDDIKTCHFNIRTNYESERDGKGIYKSVFKGYICNHTLKVEFDFDTKQLGLVISAISMCEAMPEFSISFTVKDPTQISKELLESASKNALEKATILSQASNVKLGDLISIDYNWGEINVYSNTEYKMERTLMQAKVCASDIDIQPDDICVNDTATFVWEIL